MNDTERAAQADASAEAVANEVIVKVAAGATAEEIAAVREQLGATLIESTQTLGLERWSIPGQDVASARAATVDNPHIEYMAPNRVFRAESVPGDPDFKELWGLDNQGQEGGKVDTDIDAPEAWNDTTGAGVVVGVVDSGIDYTHPDLDGNVWVNPGEIADNGIDDDGNGFVDDYHGYDFVNEDGDPYDDYFHGTHVAGTIAAEANNGEGIAGVAYDARVMGIKVLDFDGFGTEFDIIQGIEYSILMGVKITNHSYGSLTFSEPVRDAIAAAAAAGQLIVASAGNDGTDNDAEPHYPSGFDFDNIISVAATDRLDQLGEFSDYGATTVDLAAPGVEILSLLPDGGYGLLDGTSMAAPHVAGVAALLLAQDPTLTAEELRRLILEGVDAVPGLTDVTVTGGRLNAGNSVTLNAPVIELVGTAGPDVLTGSGGREHIRGLGGDDLIQGLGASDQLFGGDGRDLLVGGDGADLLDGDDGDDRLFGEAGDDSILAGDGHDILAGGAGGDSLWGGSGNDRIIGETGDDHIDGGAANDLIDGDEGADALHGGGGHDGIQGGSGNDVVHGDWGDDLIIGGTGDDVLYGGTGDDRLIGVDTTAGPPGLDEVDRLIGGRDGDLFVLGEAGRAFYENADALDPGEADYARIEDLDEGRDRIELAGGIDNYVLDFYRTEGGQLNAAVVFDAGASARGDVIAVIEDVPADLRLTDDLFRFLGGDVAAAHGSTAGRDADDAVTPEDAALLPIELTDGSGALWDIQGDGSINNGTDDAFDGASILEDFPLLDSGELEEDGREVVVGPATVGGVEILRKIFVPSDQPWARFLEVVTNTSSVTVNYDLTISTNMGSDDETAVIGTGSGDLVFDAGDRWLVTDDGASNTDPAVLQVIGGSGAEAPASAGLIDDEITFSYSLSLAPGETQIVMHFAAQSAEEAVLLDAGPLLSRLEGDALAGLSAGELAQIVNFVVAPAAPIIGTEGVDFLTGTNRSDSIEGLGGADVIEGLNSNDSLFGGDGDDFIDAGSGSDFVSGGGGDDAVLGEDGRDSISGDAGRDELLGGNGNDWLDGGGDNDRVLGEEDDDTLLGGAGDDVLDGGIGADSITAGTGTDKLYGADGDDLLAGEDGDDRLEGGRGNDRLDGGAGQDRLIGIDLAAVFGTGEKDELAGGSGRDTFVLGDGRHVFYDDGDALTPGETDLAVLVDFDAGEDRIELTGRAADYRLDFLTPTAGRLDAVLLYDTATARGDVVAVIHNVSSTLSLDDAAFVFV